MEKSYQVEAQSHSDRVNRLGSRGEELVNSTPLFVALPGEVPTLQQQIARVLRTEFAKQAEAKGFETYEEANDFDVKDDFDVDEPVSKYQDLQEEYLDDNPHLRKRLGKKVPKIEKKTQTPEIKQETPKASEEAGS